MLQRLPILQPALNTLAIGVWNSSRGSSDLVLVPRLSINRAVSPTMRFQANNADPGGAEGAEVVGRVESGTVAVDLQVGPLIPGILLEDPSYFCREVGEELYRALTDAGFIKT